MEEKTGIKVFMLSHAWAYQLFKRLIVSRESIKERVDKFVRPKSGDKILDIGCGTGDVLEFMPDVRYAGYDANPKYIEAAKKKQMARGDFICAYVEDYALPDPESYDLVLANGVFHHLNDASALKLLNTAYNALKIGGRFISTDPVFLDGQNLISRFLIRMDRGKNVRTEDGYKKLVASVFAKHVSYMTADALRVPYDHCVIIATRY